MLHSNSAICLPGPSYLGYLSPCGGCGGCRKVAMQKHHVVPRVHRPWRLEMEGQIWESQAGRISEKQLEKLLKNHCSISPLVDLKTPNCLNNCSKNAQKMRQNWHLYFRYVNEFSFEEGFAPILTLKLQGCGWHQGPSRL